MRFLRRIATNWDWPSLAGWLTYFWGIDYIYAQHWGYWWLRLVVGLVVALIPAGIAMVLVAVIEKRIRNRRQA
jgi:hypothetical protein